MRNVKDWDGGEEREKSNGGTFIECVKGKIKNNKMCVWGMGKISDMGVLGWEN